MKANELKLEDVMCGDWVDVRNASPDTPHIEKITPSHLLRDEHWYGIELTPEILEKNGFKIEEEYDEIYDTHDYYATLTCVDSEKRNVEVNYHTFRNEFTIFCHDSKNMLLYRNLETQIKYVHELQQIFKILKIDKEIVL